MKSQWTDWLREMAAAGMGGSALAFTPISRGIAYSYVMPVGADVSGDTFAADLRMAPDADGAPVAAFTVTVGAYADGFTDVTFALAAGALDAVADLDGDADGLSELVLYLFHTPAGGAQYRAAGTTITIAE